MAYIDGTTGLAVYSDGQGGYVDSQGNAVNPANIVSNTTKRRRQRRIVITETTLRGIEAIMRLARSGHAPALFRKRRRGPF